MFATMIVLYGYAIVERIPSYSASKVILCKDHTRTVECGSYTLKSHITMIGKLRFHEFVVSFV
jgi:hypothetical protein